MFKTRLLASAILALSASAPALAQDNADYRHLMFRESPYAPYRGIHPIEPEEAEAVAHYDFSYDAQGRVTRIAYQIGDTPIGDNGVFDTFIWFAPEVRIAWEDGREVHTYYGRSGEQISAHGDVYRAVYTLDETGARTALEFFDESGAPSQNAWGVHRYSWRPSDDGHIFENRYDLAGEMVAMRPELEFYEIKLEYDRDGRLAFMRNCGRNGEPANNATGAGIWASISTTQTATRSACAALTGTAMSRPSRGARCSTACAMTNAAIASRYGITTRTGTKSSASNGPGRRMAPRSPPSGR
jgi:hypothetical protein